MIEFKSVTKRYKNKIVVQETNLTIHKGECLVLLGTSGSGKTTLLRMLNRLIDPTTGTIDINGQNIQDLDIIKLRRNIGYAVQQISLFPHMTVGENVGIVLKLMKKPPDEILERTHEMLTLVGLTNYIDRFPHELSGGQKQRIGVARAIAADPPIILMDEPFGALDPITREKLQDEFQNLESQIHKTVLFVTHDTDEALKLGDRIALMHEGQILQIDTPTNIQNNPVNPLVEAFFDLAKNP
ncbi:MAG: Choline transport ATP-binding protein OpuBA [Chlamydiia bacterium]|nr:Choline transport ATP-binding protein OpuBA [Chlamydiia bacterium]MCH9616336.1 Choline transport ATP-binding protein OpuBA [Chlamydiia bacterium]MCH9629678.1 Choline transport ATP-binding protein OpuBA [Chlamydiia bacterium]